MKFGSVPTGEADGHVLAHSIKAQDISFKKGRVLTAEDIDALTSAGIYQVVAAALDADDVPEDEAAAVLAKAIAGENVTIGKAFTGRVNLFSSHHGIVVLDSKRLERINRRHEAITIATLPAFDRVGENQMLATIKIIPFAAPDSELDACLDIAREASSLVRVAPLQSQEVRLIQTRLAATSSKMLDKTARITADRLSELGSYLAGEDRCDHRTEALETAIGGAQERGFDLLLIAGASAITDRRDVLPAGVEAAGGRVLHFGMPVDPGNLLLLAELDGKPVLGLPGCARSPKLNGFDWVLQRLGAGLEVTPSDIMGMGVGGLLTEIPSRPQPRHGSGPTAQKIAALVLAAGQSRRMGERNKLLIRIDGKPMVRRAVETVAASKADQTIVITGHQEDDIRAALSG
ncbi:MAG: NTP transferase domain-containing protein, partial [Pseudomonadota bacterium]